MPLRRPILRTFPALALLGALCCASPALGQYGFILSGVGPINRSMGGASTAAPLDASGALYWNPATITGLQQSEMEFGIEAVYPHARVESSVPAGALGPGFPATDLAGSTHAENGIFPLPSFGLVYRTEDPDWALGLGIFSAGGFAVNYPGDPVNPVLSPRPPLGIGQGPVYTQFQVLQIVPTAAYQVAEGLSVGFGPVLDLALLQADPGLLLPPDVSTGVPVYPALTNTRFAFGGGFQAGAYYSPGGDWHFGTSVKSPQWFEPFRFNYSDARGVPHTDTIHADYPMIVSAGTSYTGFERWLLALDVRWVDFRDTSGFRASGFGSDGRLEGLGWNSIFGVAVGAQYKVTDALTVRGGYSWAENPVPSSSASVNVGSASIPGHTLYAGLSYRVSESLLLSLAYLHVFERSANGLLQTPAGFVPGSSVESTISADSLLLGMTVQFGARSCAHEDPED